MNVLVTGGEGFLGCHLVERFLKRGDSVISVDNHISCDGSNLDSLSDCNRLDIINADLLTSDADLWARLYDSDIDLIMHFASAASPPFFDKYWSNIYAVNTIGTMKLIELARDNGACLVFASTSEVYGNPTNHYVPSSEFFWGFRNSCGPRACYDVGKSGGESIIYNSVVNSDEPVDARIVRIFNTYGPRMHLDDGRVVTNFIKQALSGDDLTIFGDGSQKRCFCYVNDLIDGIMSVASFDFNDYFYDSLSRYKEQFLSDFYEPRINAGLWDARVLDVNNDFKLHRVFNVGNPYESHSIARVAELVRDKLNPNLKFTYEGLPKDDPLNRVPDIFKLQYVFDYEPKVKLNEGLERTIDYFKDFV